MGIQYQFSIDMITGNNRDLLADLGLELHAISSASKPVSGWVIRDAVQECREACAGHGYLKGIVSICIHKVMGTLWPERLLLNLNLSYLVIFLLAIFLLCHMNPA